MPFPAACHLHVEPVQEQGELAVGKMDGTVSVHSREPEGTCLQPLIIEDKATGFPHEYLQPVEAFAKENEGIATGHFLAHVVLDESTEPIETLAHISWCITKKKTLALVQAEHILSTFCR